jgi:hypothetical protein
MVTSRVALTYEMYMQIKFIKRQQKWTELSYSHQSNRSDKNGDKKKLGTELTLELKRIVWRTEPGSVLPMQGATTKAQGLTNLS